MVSRFSEVPITPLYTRALASTLSSCKGPEELYRRICSALMLLHHSTPHSSVLASQHKVENLFFFVFIVGVKYMLVESASNSVL